MIKKRRKLSENPYWIHHFEENNTYTITFKNNIKSYNIEISEDIYNSFDRFELDDISYMNKYDRHIEHLSLDEIQLHKRISKKEKDLEEIVIENIEKQKLYEAINKLSKSQKNRIFSYYFKNMTKKEIAIQDNCSIRAIQYSLDSALKNLKKFLK